MESPRGLREAHIHCANCRACLSLRQQSAFNNPSKQLANGSSSLRCGASPLFIGWVTWPGQSPFNSAQSIRRENSMDNNRREEELIAKLKILNMRIDWIASAEGRAALVKDLARMVSISKRRWSLSKKLKNCSMSLLGRSERYPHRAYCADFMLDLAKHIVNQKAADFDPERF